METQEIIQIETPVVEVTEEVKNPLAEQFQRIAKQEKFVQSERHKLEESKKELEADKEFAQNYKSLKGKSPFEILEHFGISYEQLLTADKERSNPIDPKVREALQKVQELESKMTQKEKQIEDEQLSRAEIQLKSDIELTIKNKEYDLIEKLDAKDAVREYMEEMYETTGSIPTIEEACEDVSKYLAEKYMAIKDSKWLKPIEEPVKEQEKQTQKANVDTTQKANNGSISNKMSQTSQHGNKPMTDSERMQAAIAVMNSMSRK